MALDDDELQWIRSLSKDCVSLDSRHGKESTVQDLIVVEVPEDDEIPGDEDELQAFEDDEGDS